MGRQMGQQITQGCKCECKPGDSKNGPASAEVFIDQQHGVPGGNKFQDLPEPQATPPRELSTAPEKSDPEQEPPPSEEKKENAQDKTVQHHPLSNTITKT